MKYIQRKNDLIYFFKVLKKLILKLMKFNFLKTLKKFYLYFFI